MNETADADGSTGGRLFALKQADTFLVADARGDLLGETMGLYRSDTRVLSQFRLRLQGERPHLLGTSISRDNVFLTANLTNRPLRPLGDEGHGVPQGILHLQRRCFLWRDSLHTCLALRNYGEHTTVVSLSLDYEADFRDIFEIRGYRRHQRGEMLPADVENHGLVLAYRGLDGEVRDCRLTFSERPTDLNDCRAEFSLPLAPRDLRVLFIEVGPGSPGHAKAGRYRSCAAAARRAMRRSRRCGARIRTSTSLFNQWLDRASADISLLCTELSTGPFPYAGIPWFSTPFGRDGIITALQTLWLNPTLARGVLSFLSATQATSTSTFQDAAPGKILHEARRGETALLGELPFARYYGGVDTTPLFVMLAGAYARRTGDDAFIDSLWPHLVSAMEWVEGAGDSDGDGFLDYARAEPSGLANQGWKDSTDSVFHADGTFPVGPIALVEVQGYVFAASLAMAELCRMRGDLRQWERWTRAAERMRGSVEQAFWNETRGFYAMALDGAHRQCMVRASNAGHLLYVGLCRPERAARLIEQFLSTDFDTRWGIRTVASGESRYNPMTYHNGSIWPHDSALCIAGMCRYRAKRQALHMLMDTFEAAVHFDMRLPELFCGFQRAPAEPPISYPVACLPQAWSSGAVFMLLQAFLGVQIRARERVILIDDPVLPDGINSLTLHDLRVADASLDLTFVRIRDRVVPFKHGPGSADVRVLADL